MDLFQLGCSMLGQETTAMCNCAWNF